MEANEQVPVNQYCEERNIPPVAMQYDPGEKTASDSRIFGIISLVMSFLLPGIVAVIFAVLGITCCGNYKKIGNGQCLPIAETGKKCSIAAICITALQIVLSVVVMLFFFGVIGAITEEFVNIDWHEILRALE